MERTRRRLTAAAMQEAVSNNDIDEARRLEGEMPVINIGLSDGHTPLTLAVSLGHDKMVKHLLSRGADSAARDEQGRTAWDIAVHNRDLIVGEILVDSIGTLTRNWPGRCTTGGIGRPNTCWIWEIMHSRRKEGFMEEKEGRRPDFL